MENHSSKILISLKYLVVVLTFLPMIAFTAEKKPAKICFQNLEYNYGTIYLGAPGKCRFYFTNCGESTLKINYVKTTCGCTEAIVSKKIFSPGEKGYIEVEYDTYRLGNIGKIIIVSTNSAGSEKTYLRIKGKVLKKSKKESWLKQLFHKR